ncbi:MAG TPA: hypothetical protein VMM78_06250 [Thermomicrobiales bacterium]|nr:hypothetical protein [Thermomicrobiales bacterium]
MIAPILHAGGFSWDEAAVLVIAILAVPALSWFTGRFGKRREGAAADRAERRARRRERADSNDTAQQ